MKANQFGTDSEQRLFRIGFQTASQRPQCGNCRSVDEQYLNTGSMYETSSYKCKKAGCAVTKTAICKEWEGR